MITIDFHVGILRCVLNVIVKLELKLKFKVLYFEYSK